MQSHPLHLSTNYLRLLALVTGDDKLNSICESVSNTTGCVALVDGSIARLCHVDNERAVARGERELITICSQRERWHRNHQGDSEEVGHAQTITGDSLAPSFTQGSDQDPPLVTVTVLFASLIK